MKIESSSPATIRAALDDLEHAVINLQGLIGALAIVAENLPLRHGEGGSEGQAANALLPLMDAVCQRTEALFGKIEGAMRLENVVA
jgi:hypothetical protein